MCIIYQKERVFRNDSRAGRGGWKRRDRNGLSPFRRCRHGQGVEIPTPYPPDDHRMSTECLPDVHPMTTECRPMPTNDYRSFPGRTGFVWKQGVRENPENGAWTPPTPRGPQDPRNRPRRGNSAAHSGILPCFFHGLSSFLVRSMRRLLAILRRVLWGMMTSSM